MKTLNFQQMEVAEGGITHAARNAGCFSMGIGADLDTISTAIGAWTAPFVGGLTVAGSIMLTDYQH